MPPLPADSIHARACKLKCEKILTRPRSLSRLLLLQTIFNSILYYMEIIALLQDLKGLEKPLSYFIWTTS